MLSTLKPDHPRLFLCHSTVQRMKTLIEKDEEFRWFYSVFLREADRILAQPVTGFQITGPRMLKNCQQISKRVSTLALAFILSDNSQYAERASAELFAAAEFPHWNKDHFLDTAELCTAFGIGYDWLYDHLNSHERGTIKTALIDKGLTVGINEYRHNAWWMTVEHNWNIVCHGGLVIGALAVAPDKKQITENIVQTALKYIPKVLKTYDPDGAWPAGPEYWEYTTQFCALTLEALKSALNMDIDKFITPGLRQAGLFSVYCTGPFDRYFNFADSDTEARAKPSLYWLGQKFNCHGCIQENRRLLLKQCENNTAPDPFDLIWYGPGSQTADSIPRSACFRGTETVFIRSAWNDQNAVYIGLKGGSNQADHAHLDLGSFVLDALGERWAADLGRDNYDLPGYWDMKEGGDRWKYFRLNNRSHNTLVINDDNQRAEAVARIVGYGFSEERHFAITDLTQAYIPHVKSALRGFAMLDDGRLIIQDEIVWAQEKNKICWNVMTDADVGLNGQTATLSIRGKTLYLNIVSPSYAAFTVRKAKRKSPENPNEDYRLLQIEFVATQKKTIICVHFTLKQNETAVYPLQLWTDLNLSKPAGQS
jgi:hypothetical protein